MHGMSEYLPTKEDTDGCEATYVPLWFYKVSMRGSINATDEEKMQVYFKMLNCVRNWN
jgi:hypothetical protein